MTTSTLPRSMFALLLTVSTAVIAQIAPARTWPELKQAVQERADSQRYPMTGFDSKEVSEILSRIQSLDRDEWARSWIQSGDHHMKQAQALSTLSPELALSLIHI